MNWLFIKGILFIIFVILSWVGTSLIIKLTLSEGEEQKAADFNKPLFIGYTACSSFTVYIFKFLYEFAIQKR